MRRRVAEAPHVRHRQRCVPAAVRPFLTSLLAHKFTASSTTNRPGLRRTPNHRKTTHLNQELKHTFWPVARTRHTLAGGPGAEMSSCPAPSLSTGQDPQTRRNCETQLLPALREGWGRGPGPHPQSRVRRVVRWRVLSCSQCSPGFSCCGWESDETEGDADAAMVDSTGGGYSRPSRRFFRR